MYFDSMSEFIAMGGHGFYVWLAYGVFLAVVIWNIAMLRINRSLKVRETKRAWKRQALARQSADENKDTDTEQNLTNVEKTF